MTTIFDKYSKVPKKYKKLLVYNVLNHNFNTNKIESFNIFNNIRVFMDSYDAIKEYKKDRNAQKLKEKINFAVRCEEHCRCEYEIAVGGLFSDFEKYEKIDCYSQFEPNLDIFIDYLVKNLE